MLKGLIALDLAVGIGLFTAAVTVDSTAEMVILYAAAIGAIGVLWRSIGKPIVAILKRTAEAVESLETLPKWREDHDERLADVEAEVGIVHVEVGNVANDVAAIRREFGIGDDDVRRQKTAVEPRGGRPDPKT